MNQPLTPAAQRERERCARICRWTIEKAERMLRRASCDHDLLIYETVGQTAEGILKEIEGGP